MAARFTTEAQLGLEPTPSERMGCLTTLDASGVSSEIARLGDSGHDGRRAPPFAVFALLTSASALAAQVVTELTSTHSGTTTRDSHMTLSPLPVDYTQRATAPSSASSGLPGPRRGRSAGGSTGEGQAVEHRHIRVRRVGCIGVVDDEREALCGGGHPGEDEHG